MKVYILCGDSTFDVAFMQVDNETVIGRTIRILKQMGQDVYLVGKYQLPNTTTVFSGKETLCEVLEELSLSYPCLVLYSDTWYSKNALYAMLGEEVKDYKAFGNSAPNERTGKPYPEIYGWRFEQPIHLNGFKPIAWEGYELFSYLTRGDAPFSFDVKRERFTEIDDDTDDFDNLLDVFRYAECTKKDILLPNGGYIEKGVEIW